MSYITFILGGGDKKHLNTPQCHHGLCSSIRKRHPYPAVQLGGEFGLELTGGTIAVVSLDKDLGGQGGTSPELL